MNGNPGKGSVERPFSVSKTIYAMRWYLTFSELCFVKTFRWISRSIHQLLATKPEKMVPDLIRASCMCKLNGGRGAEIILERKPLRQKVSKETVKCLEEHGASRLAVDFARSLINKEINK